MAHRPGEVRVRQRVRRKPDRGVRRTIAQPVHTVAQVDEPVSQVAEGDTAADRGSARDHEPDAAESGDGRTVQRERCDGHDFTPRPTEIALPSGSGEEPVTAFGVPGVKTSFCVRREGRPSRTSPPVSRSRPRTMPTRRRLSLLCPPGSRGRPIGSGSACS